MFKHSASLLVTLSTFLEMAQRAEERFKQTDEWDRVRLSQVAETDRQRILELRDGMLVLCRLLDLASTQKAFSRLAKQVESGDTITVEDYCRRCADVHERFLDDLDDQSIFATTTEFSKHWYRDDRVSDEVRVRFPESATEIRAAGNAYCCGLWTSSVFHSMRAAETGLRVVHNELVGVPPSSIAGMKEVIGAIRTAANKIDEERRSEERSARSKHYSEIAANALLFKDAWRNHVAHAHVTYDHQQALRVMESTCAFFEGIVAPVVLSKV